MNGIINQIIKECDEEGQVKINTYDSLLTVEDLIFLRSLHLNITWNQAELYLTDQGYSLEFRLELINWIDLKEHEVIELDYNAHDDLLLGLKDKGFQVSLGHINDYELNHPLDMIKHVEKCKLIDSPVFIGICNINFPKDYCELIDYPFEEYKYGIVYSPLTDALNRGDERFLLLVNQDVEMEYCTREEFNRHWLDIDMEGITNHKALQHLKDLGREIITTEDIFNQYDKPEGRQLQLAHATIDLLDSFSHLDKLISLGTENLLVASIIVRLMKNRLIDLSPYLDDPFLEHLYQFQHRPKVKSARNVK